LEKEKPEIGLDFYVSLFLMKASAETGEGAMGVLATRRLVKHWMKRKAEIDRQILREGISTDEQFTPILFRLWDEIGPMWEEAFRADHPNKVYHHRNLKDWIEVNEAACRKMGNTREALAWVQMYNFFINMLDQGLIPRDPEEPIRIKKARPL
jgi:hypothetical protein